MIFPAGGGIVLTVTAYGAEAIPDPQALVPATVMLPLNAPVAKSTRMLLVLEPEEMEAPVGKVHV